MYTFHYQAFTTIHFWKRTRDFPITKTLTYFRALFNITLHFHASNGPTSTTLLDYKSHTHTSSLRHSWNITEPHTHTHTQQTGIPAHTHTAHESPLTQPGPTSPLLKRKSPFPLSLSARAALHKPIYSVQARYTAETRKYLVFIEYTYSSLTFSSTNCNHFDFCYSTAYVYCIYIVYM